MGTILRMGVRDTYALLEDFAWYLLILAELAANVSTTHGDEIATQMIDICVRVPLVRPYAVTMALSLLDRSSAPNAGGEAEASTEQAMQIEVAPAVVGACAYIVGEYSDSFEAPAEPQLKQAVRALLVAKHVQNLAPAVQSQCVWAAMKIYIGASKHAPGAVNDIHNVVSESLPTFLVSTQVDVAERAALSLHLSGSFKGDAANV